MSFKRKNYDILIIDGDAPTIRLISIFFENKGVSCKGVMTGRDGLSELEAWLPKVILLDIMLPDINGRVLCKTIKTNKHLVHVPIYFATVLPKIEVKTHVKEAGADGYILKPFDLEDFDVILNLL